MNETVVQYLHQAGILIPIVIIIGIITYAGKVIDILDRWKLRKLNTLSALHSRENLDDDIKNIIKFEIDNKIFATVTGIKVGTCLRKQLIALYNKNNELFTWKKIRMAIHYITINNKKIIIKISFVDKLLSVFVAIGAVFALVLIFFAIVALTYGEYTTFNLLISFIMIFIGVISFFSYSYFLMKVYIASQLSLSLKDDKKINKTSLHSDISQQKVDI